MTFRCLSIHTHTHIYIYIQVYHVLLLVSEGNLYHIYIENIKSLDKKGPNYNFGLENYDHLDNTCSFCFLFLFCFVIKIER